jgi:hypothetical protein
LLARGELQTTGDDQHAAGDEQAQDHLDEAAAALGLVIEPADAGARGVDQFHLWAEHVDALNLWFGVQTQWRHGFNGPTGLDYAGVRAAPGFRALPRVRREPVFGELCIMERATLGEWALQRAAAKR